MYVCVYIKYISEQRGVFLNSRTGDSLELAPEVFPTFKSAFSYVTFSLFETNAVFSPLVRLA